MTIPIFISKNTLFIYVFLGLSPNKEKQNIKLCDFYSCACAFVAKWFLIGFSPRLRASAVRFWFLVAAPLLCISVLVCGLGTLLLRIGTGRPNHLHQHFQEQLSLAPAERFQHIASHGHAILKIVLLAFAALITEFHINHAPVFFRTDPHYQAFSYQLLDHVRSGADGNSNSVGKVAHNAAAPVAEDHDGPHLARRQLSL